MAWRMRGCGWVVLLTAVALAGAARGGQTEGASAMPQVPRVFCISPAVISKVKARVAAGDPSLKPALDKLVVEADKALKMKPVSVMDKDLVPPSGDKHDYMSFGTYWWPDPKKKDGLPYIRRDGEVNPDTRKQSDSPRFWGMVQSVKTLGLAYYLTGRDAYASHAARLLRVWFLDPATRMNPHLEYGQAIPGRCKGRGIGIIDTRGLPGLVDAVGLLASSKNWTDRDQQGMVAWIGSYLAWLRTSRHGKAESVCLNNHGTWYDVQVASFALFVGKADLARRTIQAAKQNRIRSQIEPDGRQPLELRRTQSFGYSVMNLNGMFTLAALGERVGVDLWRYESRDGRSIRKALDFLAPYRDRKKEWPFPQIKPAKRAALLALLRHASVAYAEDAYEAMIDAHPSKPAFAKDRFQLICPPGRSGE